MNVERVMERRLWILQNPMQLGKFLACLYPLALTDGPCSKGFLVMALSTKDKQGLYEHLGYIRTTKPITAMGSANKFLNAGQLSGLQTLFGGGATKTVSENITWYRKSIA